MQKAMEILNDPQQPAGACIIHPAPGAKGSIALSISIKMFQKETKPSEEKENKSSEDTSQAEASDQAQTENKSSEDTSQVGSIVQSLEVSW
jgi:hypothetical protein